MAEELVSQIQHFTRTNRCYLGSRYRNNNTRYRDILQYSGHDNILKYIQSLFNEH